MKVALVPDTTPSIGTGHLMRCRALAEALKARGAATAFPEKPGSDSCDWLVVDHYGLGAAWEGEMRSRAAKILAIDDLADRRHDCDLLLDQNFFPDAERRYAGLVHERCRKLLGPRFALLRSEFLEKRKSIGARNGKVQRVLVTFGGLDAGNETSKAVALLKGRGLAVDVVVGAANPHAAQIERDCAAAAFHFHRQVSNMAELMAAADLAVGAGGSTTWERCCLGLPAVQVCIAPNQEPLTKALAHAGYVTWSGNSLTKAALEKALSDPAMLKRQSEMVMTLVDGEGAKRVAAALFASPGTNLQLRSAGTGDSRLYFDWANDPEVRRQSFDSRAIAWPEHEAWFRQRLAEAVLLVAEDEAGMPAGQARFEQFAGGWQLSYSMAAEFRGAGLAAKMLSMAIQELRRKHPRARLRAEVKADNAASRQVFVKLGFAKKSETLFELAA